MKNIEVQNFVKNAVITNLGLADCGTQIGRGKYAVPVETPENGTVYATVTVTCTRFANTEKTSAFDLDLAVEKFQAEEDEKAEKARARAEAAAMKKAAKGN